MGVISPEDKEKAEGNVKSPLAQRGFVAVPAVGTHGGILARGDIVRDVTINLVALRRLHSSKDPDKLRRYILGLSLVAATEPLDGYLRQGCLLVQRPDKPAIWEQVARTGERTPIDLTNDAARKLARTWASEFGIGASRTAKFDRNLAEADLGETGSSKGKGKAKKAG